MYYFDKIKLQGEKKPIDKKEARHHQCHFSFQTPVSFFPDLSLGLRIPLLPSQTSTGGTETLTT